MRIGLLFHKKSMIDPYINNVILSQLDTYFMASCITVEPEKNWVEKKAVVCVWHGLKSQLFLLFSLFLLLFIGLTALFYTIHGSYGTILTTF